MKLTNIIILFAAFLASTVVATASAQSNYPERAVNIVVGVPAGGSIDMVARLVGQKLAEELGQPFVIENKAGGAGVIGTNAVAKAKPDGYTLGLVPAAFIATNKSIFAKLPYDPEADFAPISKLVNQTMVLVVRSDSKFKSVGDLTEYAKNNPEKLNFGSGGEGSPHHLSGVLFGNKAQLKLTHIPYKGSAPALSDLLGGHVDMVFAGIPEVISNIKANKLTALAVLSGQRSSLLPTVPTLVEKGYPGVELSAWMGLVAPANTPQDIVQKLNQAVVKVLNADARIKLAEVGLEASSSTPEEFSELIHNEINLHGVLVRSAGIKPQ